MRCLRAFVCLSLCLLVYGCASSYRDTYHYVSPATHAGQSCVSRCFQVYEACNSRCQVKHHQYQCVQAKQQKFQYQSYLNQRELANQPMDRTLADFSVDSLCPAEHECRNALNLCYQSCGGQVQVQHQCLHFCG